MHTAAFPASVKESWHYFTVSQTQSPYEPKGTSEALSLTPKIKAIISALDKAVRISDSFQLRITIYPPPPNTVYKIL